MTWNTEPGQLQRIPTAKFHIFVEHLPRLVDAVTVANFPITRVLEGHAQQSHMGVLPP